MKGTTISIIVLGAAIAGAIIFFGQGRSQGGYANGSSGAPANNVSVVNGKQIVEINVRGGYYPGLSEAQAGIPTILRMKTSGTYDCSSIVSIRSLGVFKNLPASGNTDIEIPAQTAGSRLQGTCAMGMYRFAIDFK